MLKFNRYFKSKRARIFLAALCLLLLLQTIRGGNQAEAKSSIAIPIKSLKKFRNKLPQRKYLKRSPIPPKPIEIIDIADRPIREFKKEGRRLFVLYEDMAYCDDLTGNVIVVPYGFVTDFASIPQPAGFVFKPDGAYAPAAIVHDYLYAIGIHGDENSRLNADRIFKDAMKEYGVDRATSKLLYSAVRKGGRKGFGLVGDYLFYDLRYLKPEMPPRPHPKQVIYENIGSGCPNFQELVLAKGGFSTRLAMVEHRTKADKFLGNSSFQQPMHH